MSPEFFTAYVWPVRLQLITTAMRMGASPQLADDAVSVVMVKALECKDLAAEKVKPWLFLCMKRWLIDEHRRSCRRKNVELDAADNVICAESSRAIQRLEKRGELARLTDFVALLPRFQRLVVEAVAEVESGDLFRQAAKKLGVKPATAKSRFYRAIGKLRRRMK